jgi:4-carboxymuconolactone decarboxylase
MLIALRAENELKGHVRGALRNGLTRTEIVETVIHASAYCGAPAGLAAMRVVQEVLDNELGPLQN